MAQQSEASIPKAGKRKWGYDPAQVDAFLERAHALYDSEGAKLTQRDIQNVSFDLARGGYVIAQVDAALARLERAVVDKQTTWEISQHGRVAWKAQTEELYRDIARHADRAEGERFGSGKQRVPSYDRKQVDRLTDQVVDRCAAELDLDGVSRKDVKGLEHVTAEYVANAVFTQRKGRKGYDERQVDYFLNSCVELLSRIESYDRIADYLNADGTEAQEQEASIAAAPVAGVSGVTPLFSADVRHPRPAASAPAQGPAQASSDGFDALSQAEQSLFSFPNASAPSPVAAPAAVASPAPASTPSFLPKPGDAPSFLPKPGDAPSFQTDRSSAQSSVFAAPASAPANPASSVMPAPAQTVAPASATPSASSSVFSSTPTPAASPSTSSAASMSAASSVPPSFAPAVTPERTGFGTPMPVLSNPYSATSAPSASPASSTTPTVAIDVASVRGTASAPVNASLASLAAASTPAAPAAPAAPASEDTPFWPAASFAAGSPAPQSTAAAHAAPASDAASSSATHSAAAQGAAAHTAPTPTAGTSSFSLLSTTNSDLEIPDLTFPTLTLGNMDEKKQQ